MCGKRMEEGNVGKKAGRGTRGGGGGKGGGGEKEGEGREVGRLLVLSKPAGGIVRGDRNLMREG